MTDSTSSTSMSILTSTSTEPHKEAGDSFVHSVRKYELKDQVYPLVGHMDYVHEFNASTTTLQQMEYGDDPSSQQSRSENPFTAEKLGTVFSFTLSLKPTSALGPKKSKGPKHFSIIVSLCIDTSVTAFDTVLHIIQHVSCQQSTTLRTKLWSREDRVYR